jgi:hypothetical protein
MSVLWHVLLFPGKSVLWHVLTFLESICKAVLWHVLLFPGKSTRKAVLWHVLTPWGVALWRLAGKLAGKRKKTAQQQPPRFGIAAWGLAVVC